MTAREHEKSHENELESDIPHRSALTKHVVAYRGSHENNCDALLLLVALCRRILPPGRPPGDKQETREEQRSHADRGSWCHLSTAHVSITPPQLESGW